MGSIYSANVFAAGDFGGRFGQFEAEATASQLLALTNRITAEHVAILGLLPNARLNRLHGTAAPRPGDAETLCPECTLAWRVLLSGKPVHETNDDGPRLAVPLEDPGLPGFPGVLIASRPTGAVAFNQRDVELATEQAQQIGRRFAAQRHHPTGACGIVLIDAKINSLLSSRNCLLDQLDPKVRAGLIEDAKTRLSRKPKRTASRIRIRDSHGAFQNLRVELRRNLPIADGGAVLAYTLPPRIEDWNTLDESSFAGDPEVQRLIPALKFMINKFAALPGLPQIAQKAKLSPFHFHREFSARLGISPKHLMLDCQIEHASQQLLRGDVELVQIARSCGFAHQSHFTSRFKQATGLTPTAWRKAMRASPAKNA